MGLVRGYCLSLPGPRSSLPERSSLSCPISGDRWHLATSRPFSLHLILADSTDVPGQPTAGRSGPHGSNGLVAFLAGRSPQPSIFAPMSQTPYWRRCVRERVGEQTTWQRPTHRLRHDYVSKRTQPGQPSARWCGRSRSNKLLAIVWWGEPQRQSPSAPRSWMPSW